MLYKQRAITAALICGLLGCLCMGGGDWLMIYGDTAYAGTVPWLTSGVAQIAPWRNNLAMALAFPAVILYGVALFSIEGLIAEYSRRRIYHYLTVFSLTPWLCLHLFYIMILYGFAWMSGSGYSPAALSVSETLYSHFVWLVPVSEALMLPPYLYWGWLLWKKGTALPQWMALSNPLIFYAVLKLLTLFMPEGAFRLAFTNGLMSESMALWFGTILVWNGFHHAGFYLTNS